MPSFVKALRKATSNYIKSASNSISKKLARQTMRLSKSISTEIAKGIKYNGPTASELNGSGGSVFLLSNRFSQRLKNSLQESNRQFMEEVFALSQEYVPIDKRYAKAKNLQYLSRRVDRQILSVNDENEFKDIFSNPFDTRTNINAYYDQYEKVKNPSTGKWEYKNVGPIIKASFTSFVRERGWYDKSEIDFIKEMFRGSNRSTGIGRVYYDKSTGLLRVRRQKRVSNSLDSGFKLRQTPYDISKVKHRTNIQPSGGFQELKKSGKLYDFGKDGFQISYNGYDKTRPTNTFNYAALQHDNLAFKHEYGKSMFLHRAFLERRRQWYKNIEDALNNAVQNK